jgi:energy-coupling factor transporter ATP-binding protein EcfA2
MTTLTVREVVYYSAQLQLPDSMPLADKRKRAEETIDEMGLTGAADTRIGGWAHKGISGGQKRRVSICMEILTRPELLFLDEPTSGLDSAASYHVMSRIAILARREGMTIVSAIHQPSSEVFELFHGLCLLAYGQTVYFGPAKHTSEVLFLFVRDFIDSLIIFSRYILSVLSIIDTDFSRRQVFNNKDTKYSITIIVKYVMLLLFLSTLIPFLLHHYIFKIVNRASIIVSLTQNRSSYCRC